MSYFLKTNDEGSVIVYPLEMPMHEGTNSELSQQALNSLASGLRHMAVYEYIDSVAEENDWASQEEMSEHFANSVDRLISCTMSVIGILDNMGVDIMQRIMETM